jgi:hypothetical protein
LLFVSKKMRALAVFSTRGRVQKLTLSFQIAKSRLHIVQNPALSF